MRLVIWPGTRVCSELTKAASKRLRSDSGRERIESAVRARREPKRRKTSLPTPGLCSGISESRL